MAMAPTFDTAGWFANGPGIFRRGGAVLLDGTRVEASIKQMIVANDAFEQADAEVVALHKTFLERASPALPVTNTRALRPMASITGAKRFASSRRARPGRPTAPSSRAQIRDLAPA
jgi:hypothetical protein